MDGPSIHPHRSPPHTQPASTSSSWADPKPSEAAASLSAMAPVAAPTTTTKKRPVFLLRRSLLQVPHTELASPASPEAARAAASIVAVMDSGANPSLVEVPYRASEAASAVGGGDTTGGAMEAAAEDERAVAVAAAAADPTVPLVAADRAVPPTGPIPATLADRLKAQDADEPAPQGPGVSVFLEEKEKHHEDAGVPGGAPTVERVDGAGALPPPPHTSPHAAAAAPLHPRDSMESAALPGARTYAATKPVPLAATPAPSGLGPVFVASLPAALPGADDHGSEPAGRAAAVGGTDVCAVPGGKLLVLTADAVSVRDAASGALVAGPTPLSALMQDASGGVYTSPRCVYDGAADRPGERRTYLAALRAPAAGGTWAGREAGEPAARLVVAATADGTGGDPTGAWHVFTIAVDGIDRRSAPGGSKLPGAATCPSLGCTARGLALGLDGHGLWATTDLWTPPAGDAAGASGVAPSSLVGPLAVGLSKAALKGGAPSRPPAVVLTGFPLWAAHGGLVPSVTEAWASHDSRAGGSVYLAGVGDGRVGLWGVHGTAALRDGLTATADGASASARPSLPYPSPAPFLVERTRAADNVPPALSAGIQRPSSLVLAGGDAGPAGATATTAAPTAPLDPGAPRRLARAAWADGALWLATSSPVFAGGLSPTLGTAYFVIRPDVGGRGLRSGGTAIDQSGWVAVDGAATLAPAIAVGKNSVAVLAFALASPAFEPGFAYATLAGGGGRGGPSAVKVVAAGQPSGGVTPAAALARATQAESARATGDVRAFSMSGSGSPPPPTPPQRTSHTPDIAAGSGHAGALDSIAVGLFSAAVSDPSGEAFWVGGRRAACGGLPGVCEPAWATAVGRVTVAAELI